MKKIKPHTYTLMDVMLASNTEPMPQAKRRHILTRAHGAMFSVARGDAPNKDDWRVLADAINMMETLCRNDVVDDSDGLIESAIEAMAKAAERSQQGKGIRLDATGIDAINSVLEDYQAVLTTISHRTMLMCHREAEKRVRDLLDGKRQEHDVVVVSL